MSRKVWFVSLFVVFVMVLSVVIVNAQGPQPGGTRRGAPGAPAGTGARLTYQGRLTNSSGAPLNSAVNMVFKLYDSSSVLRWTSATRSVTPVNGLFTVYLGYGSDPDLGVLDLVAFIGVTVGSDPEMTPRQPLNTVVGHSEIGSGVVGSSNNYRGVEGTSNTGWGVFGQTDSLVHAGVYAEGGGPSGDALSISNGGIQVVGAGAGANTPVFVHVVTAYNINPANTPQTIISHVLTDGDPYAILIITPSHNYGGSGGGFNSSHPVGVSYNPSFNKWVIYNIDGTPMVAGQQFNVLVVKP
jgi:hypothetical protein